MDNRALGPLDGRLAEPAEAAARETRKPVTVLFADLVESTRLGRQLDPEALRRLLLSYFAAMQCRGRAPRRHRREVHRGRCDGGVRRPGRARGRCAARGAGRRGDARVARRLNEELERTWGISLEGRIGINTGEVIAGDHLHGQPFVAGRVVNVAKRLEEAAGTNEILMSEATHDLVRAAVVVEPVADRLVKGGETVEALRLVTVFEHAPGRARRFDSPLVGREGS